MLEPIQWPTRRIVPRTSEELKLRATNLHFILQQIIPLAQSTIHVRLHSEIAEVSFFNEQEIY